MEYLEAVNHLFSGWVGHCWHTSMYIVTGTNRMIRRVDRFEYLTCMGEYLKWDYVDYWGNNSSDAYSFGCSELIIVLSERVFKHIQTLSYDQYRQLPRHAAVSCSQDVYEIAREWVYNKYAFAMLDLEDSLKFRVGQYLFEPRKPTHLLTNIDEVEKKALLI